jgi:hypothetical protein
VSKNELLPRVWWRNAIHDSHKTLRLQELWAVCDPARTNGTERETEAKSGIEGRRTSEKEKRIPQMVSKQETIDSEATLETENQQTT